MSPIPAFELGLWNAWLLMLYMVLANILPYTKSEWRVRSGADMPLDAREKKISSTMSFLVFALIVYSIFLPLELGTAWFYVGLAIYLLGAFTMTLAMAQLFTAPAGKPITTGMYSVSRNPGYVGMVLVFGGTGIACVSWVFLLLTAVMMILLGDVSSEERFCIQTYGKAYEEYMRRTPKWLGIPKSDRKD